MDRELVAGEMFGEFRVRAVAGRGGMGIVYVATQASLGRPVALKLLAAEHAHDADLQLRFLREARLAAAIDHPHVVPIYAAGNIDGTTYIAMQWIDDGTGFFYNQLTGGSNSVYALLKPEKF